MTTSCLWLKEPTNENETGISAFWEEDGLLHIQEVYRGELRSEIVLAEAEARTLFEALFDRLSLFAPE